MWLSILLSALSLLLAALCAIDVYKNFMKERRSISGINLTLVIALIVVAVFCSLTSGSNTFWLQHYLRMISKPDNYEPKAISAAAASIPYLKSAVIRSLVYGYVSFGIQFIYMYLLRRKIDNDVKTNKKGKWTYK